MTAAPNCWPPSCSSADLSAARTIFFTDRGRAAAAPGRTHRCRIPPGHWTAEACTHKWRVEVAGKPASPSLGWAWAWAAQLAPVVCRAHGFRLAPSADRHAARILASSVAQSDVVALKQISSLHCHQGSHLAAGLCEGTTMPRRIARSFAPDPGRFSSRPFVLAAVIVLGIFAYVHYTTERATVPQFKMLAGNTSPAALAASTQPSSTRPVRALDLFQVFSWARAGCR